MKNIIFGTTIETNTTYPIHNAPPPEARAYWIEKLRRELSRGVMITIEPILDFDVVTMINWLTDIKPLWVNIGADSKGHKLPEPSPEKVKKLIEELKKFTEVKVKDNLKRIMKQAFNSLK